MKKIAIILSMLLLSQTAYAGGTLLYMDSDQYDGAAYTAQNGDEAGAADKKTSKKRKFRLGSDQNNPNSYWNYGAVNFGSGFSSNGSSVKRY